ncbi:MAG TPA: type II toxin-antitoxin system Phd/YefM family antitoxin [Allosphingosinicella sp.]|nr:type II toxin-antitoxin system Phd/YefM family antitoxin [Allosphingosinicella sp.]
MAQFSVHYAKTNLSKLIAAALEGGEVVIARGNVPVVRLVPVVPRGTRWSPAHMGSTNPRLRFRASPPRERATFPAVMEFFRHGDRTHLLDHQA